MTDKEAEPYPGYADCCARWDTVRKSINPQEYLDRIKVQPSVEDGLRLALYELSPNHPVLRGWKPSEIEKVL